MTEVERVLGVALLCTPEGNLIEVARDDLGVAAGLAPGQPFALIADRESLGKALNFLLDVRTRGVAFGWELNIRTGDTTTTLHFAGAVVRDSILILGATTANGVLALQEEMMRISSEQANALRTATKEQVQAPRGERASDLYDEISRLNNELVNLQRELAKKNVELERLNQLKNQFLGMAAHDLRAPLGIISGYSEFLADEAGPLLSEEQAGFLETIRSSSDFMLSLVNDLLDVSSIESGRLNLDLEPTDLAALIDRNIAMNQVLAARKRVTLAVRCAGGVPALLVDRAKIEQVMNNLVGNAVKFSESGGRVDVRLSREGDEVVLAVRDEGPGIPAAEQERLFRPFGRTSVRAARGEKSTGLGLAIVRRVVEGHGGKVWVESEVGQGSTFFVSLPIDGV